MLHDRLHPYSRVTRGLDLCIALRRRERERDGPSHAYPYVVQPATPPVLNILNLIVCILLRAHSRLTPMRHGHAPPHSQTPHPRRRPYRGLRYPERSLIFRGEHCFRAARVLRGIEGMMQELPQEHGRVHRCRQLKAYPPREASARRVERRASVGCVGRADCVGRLRGRPRRSSYCSGRRRRRGSGSGLEGIQI